MKICKARSWFALRKKSCGDVSRSGRYLGRTKFRLPLSRAMSKFQGFSPFFFINCTARDFSNTWIYSLEVHRVSQNLFYLCLIGIDLVWDSRWSFGKIISWVEKGVVWGKTSWKMAQKIPAFFVSISFESTRKNVGFWFGEVLMGGRKWHQKWQPLLAAVLATRHGAG